MAFKIEKPGIYLDVASADYFADPLPKPSFSQSIGKIMLAKSALHAWYAHSRLNPDFVHDDDKKYDIGNIAHSLIIGRGKEIEVIKGYDDWRTNAAKQAREAAAASGKLGVLPKHHTLATRMVTSALAQLQLRGLDSLFKIGDGEVVVAWEERGIWLRQMIDWLAPDRLIFADYKTTAESAAPQDLARKLVNDGWHIQAAMGERGLNVLHPQGAGKRRYFFVVQEIEPPYCLNVVEISEAALTLGRKQLDMAIDKWRMCMAADLWPGYPLEIVKPEIPGWFEQQWLNREVEASERPENVLMAG